VFLADNIPWCCLQGAVSPADADNGTLPNSSLLRGNKSFTLGRCWRLLLSRMQTYLSAAGADTTAVLAPSLLMPLLVARCWLFIAPDGSLQITQRKCGQIVRLAYPTRWNMGIA
jgi:hypothetical protein